MASIEDANSGSRFALEPQATGRCLAEVPVPPGGPTKLFNGFDRYAWDNEGLESLGLGIGRLMKFPAHIACPRMSGKSRPIS